jgi:UDP-galactopyranose mutase
VTREHAKPQLLCFSHLRWGFVRQRPQHLMSRFARDYAVFFMEEPEQAESGTAELKVAHDDGVTILTPMIPAEWELGWGFNERVNSAIRRLLTRPGSDRASRLDVVWHYTPMALGAAPETFDSALVVYDAMDELASFRGAPKDLREREAALLERADLVFAGGPSLHRARQGRHARAHCFPSGVEARHFARNPERETPPDAHEWPSPVLGFYGVLDERIDFDLIAGIAEARPEWTLVLIGPHAKISERDLPRRSNILYPGQRDYGLLPAYLDRFDVAILPFALNEATRFISPTKTLEYLAAEKPVVSTAIRDVIDLYGEAVAIAATPEQFIAEAEMALARPNIARRAAGLRLARRHDWDCIAERMLTLMQGGVMTPVPIDDALFLAS